MIALACALAGAALAAPPVAQAPRTFARILYMHGGPARGDALWKAVRELGFDAVSAGSADALDAAERAGLRGYRDQIVGKGVLELRREQWDPVWARYESERDPRTLIRPACLSDRDTVAELEARLGRELEALAGRHPLGVVLADEPSATRLVNPLDLCRGPACCAAFRAFLAARYGTPAAVGVAWQADIGAWDAVEPWTADRIRARALRRGMLPGNLRPWSDHLEFRDRVFVDLVASLARRVTATTGLPAGITGMQPPSAYGGYDYVALMPSQTFYEVYDIGGARELARSLAPPGAHEFATLFPLAADEPDGIVAARLFDLLAHGASGAIVWSCGEVFAGEACEPSRFGRAVVHAFAALGAGADRTAGAAMLRSPVWIVESQASVRAHWMVDSAGDGRTWIRRFGSYERTHSTSQAARASWQKLLEDLGHQPRFVPESGLGAALRIAPPRLLVLPATLALSDASAAGIAEYVAAGGHVVADHGTGFYDEHLVLRARPVLDALFGLEERAPAWPQIREGRGPAEPRTVTGVAVAESDVGAEVAEPVGDGRVVHCERRRGGGRAVYLNLAVCEYAALRLDPERTDAARDLRARLRRVLSDAGVAPLVAVRGPGLPACIEVVPLEATDGARLVAVRLNALDRPAVLTAIAERGPAEVVLEFAREVRLRDVIGGEDLGRGRHFERVLDPFAGLLLEIGEDR